MIRNLRHAWSSCPITKISRINRFAGSFLASNNQTCLGCTLNRNFARKDDSSGSFSASSLFKPVPIKQTQDDINVGEEITGSSIDKAELLKILNRFSQQREIRLLCIEHGLDRK